ncbi:MAG: hypothetical protein IPM38_00310 [Ignavibacteria bacterium]|nr:hypothetical protein [Ignavibacteria bacterium]
MLLNYKTTNSGENWTQIPGGPFTDIYFADSLTGWKVNAPSSVIRKTNDGGLNWLNQSMPQGGNVLVSQILRFSNVNKDTIWAVGGSSRSPVRGIIYRTTNQGETGFINCLNPNYY